MRSAGRAEMTVQIYLQTGIDARTDWTNDFREMKRSGIERVMRTREQTGFENYIPSFCEAKLVMRSCLTLESTEVSKKLPMKIMK